MTIKFQSGGLAPLVSYEPVTVTGGAAATTSEESSSGSDLTDKDLLEKIQSLASEIEDVRWYLEKILEKMILYTDLHEQ